ncbi:unnamed protein product [Acidocella sp. C78]|nr:unnamed protein product [Acidocella sp. C78]
MADNILEARGLAKGFRGFMAVQDVDLSIERDSIHALIGRMAPARPPASTC